VSGNDLWVLQPTGGVHDEGTLIKTSVNGGRTTAVLRWREKGRNRFAIENSRGGQLPAAERHRLATGWNATALGTRPDGAPIVATDNGDLYQVLGKDKLRRWTPTGYEKARDKAHSSLVSFGPGVLMLDHDKGLYVIGQNGIVHIPERGSATGVLFPGGKEGDAYSSVGAISAQSGILIADSDSGLLSVDSHGRAQFLVKRRSYETCAVRGPLSSIENDSLGGMTLRSNGVVAVTGLNCGRVYGLQLQK
jgi:hypothetical protein